MVLANSISLTKTPAYLGIDPGKSGGAGLLNFNGGIIGVFKFKDLTMRDMFDNVFEWRRAYKIEAALEKVHSMPGQGVASTFKFGQNFGQLEMMLTAVKTPFDYVTPQKWQKAMQCLTKGDKNVSKARAQQIWPEQKMTHAIADALLIAEYCRRTSLNVTGT